MLKKWIVLFCFSLPAWGYNLTQDFINGFYWASLPVQIVVIESDSNRKALLDQLTRAAVEEWENKTGLNLWDITGGGTTNIIRWSKNFTAETQMDSTSVLAVAIRYTNGPYFAKSEIIINGSHDSFNTPFTNINKMNIGTTLVHELGHTMGLDHSENMLAVMAPTLQYPYNGLHHDDLIGMNDVHDQTEHRQVTRYVSPLAYTKETESSQPLSCGTVGTAAQSTGGANGFISLSLGMLIGFVRKVLLWFKSRF
ncbi:MAG: matrixin family metalloprotease [Bacteriovoracia bacterium]